MSKYMQLAARPVLTGRPDTALNRNDPALNRNDPAQMTTGLALLLFRIGYLNRTLRLTHFYRRTIPTHLSSVALRLNE